MFKKKFTLSPLKRFNRTILECKAKVQQPTQIELMDLIEPYWNVKMIVVCMEIDKFADLIEPYWNVKAEHLILENHI